MGDRFPQMFRFAPDIFQSLTVADLDATAKDMVELGIYKPPYNEFVINVDQAFFASLFQEKQYKNYVTKEDLEELEDIKRNSAQLYFYYSSLFQALSDGNAIALFGIKRPGDSQIMWLRRDQIKTESQSTVANLSIRVLQVLIVLLATPNAEKKTVQNSPRSVSHRARKDAKDFEYTTTIRIGRITESHGGDGTGASKRPHLRRGHIRRQRVGVGRTEVKKIFIPPMFVNADENWVQNDRTHYNVVMAKQRVNHA